MNGSTARRPVGRVAFDVMPLESAIDAVLEPTMSGRDVHFANAFSIALAERDESFADLLAAASLVFSDGVPVGWVGRLAHKDVAARWERVYGPDVMLGVFARSDAGRDRHYLLGGSRQTVAKLETRLRAGFPSASIVGSESPPFRPPTPRELGERDERIRASGATLVWVGLGTPQQDFEVRRLAAALPVTALGVGAAFDFLAGTKPQAPHWMQRGGLEWAFRLGTEPRRLAWRYAWGNTVFGVAAVRTLRGRTR